MSFADQPYGFGPLAARRDWALWGTAAAIVLAVHVSGGWYLSRQLEISTEPPAAAKQSMVVDLTPVMQTTPDAVESETLTEEPPTEMAAAETPVEAAEQLEDAVQPEVAEAVTAETAMPVQEDVPPQTVAEDAATAETEDTPVVQEAVEPETLEQEVAEVEPVEQEVAEAEPVQADVVTEEVIEMPAVALPDTDIPLPVTRPTPPQPRETVERPQRREPPRERAQPQREQPRQQARQPERQPERQERRPTQQARPQPRSQASTEQRASSAPRVSPARWQNQVSSMIQRRMSREARRLRARGQRVVVAFTITASGSVAGARVVSSSGDGAVDEAALRAVRGISPPPPPSGSSENLRQPVLVR
ncbi:energy transducer TonB [Tianweitania sediminis]|uniref:TonB family protein n=1 Tax=Tianweitania sediminis TaxID=1502156 RepID=A0A8J7UJE9_9HYPH|nr:energy transducer TonB [Tianweitania sediminis]MBP0437272.1 TonB family protein [Tianweitania sediminis]